MLPIRIKACSESDLRMLGDLAHNIQRVLPVTQADIDAAAALGEGWVVWRVIEVTDPIDNLRGGTQLVIKQNSITPGQNVRRVLIVSGPGGETVVIGPGPSPLLLPDAVADSLAYVKAFGGTEQRNIPDNYIERQFIYMMDGSYLLTDIVPTYDSRIEMDFQTTTLPSGSVYFGGGRTETNGGLFFARTTNAGFIVDAFGARYNSNISVSNNTRYKFTYDNQVAKVESAGTTLFTNTFTGTGETGAAFCINGLNTAGTITTTNTGIYVYSFKAWNAQGELVMNLVPAVQKGTVPVVGFYDTVSKTFKTATSGTFAAGGEAVPTPDTPMDIVSNNGVLKASRNLFDVSENPLEQGGIASSGGQNTAASYDQRARTKGYIPVKPSTTYTASVKNLQIYYLEYEQDKTYTDRHASGFSDNSVTFTTEANTYFIRLQFRKSNNSDITPSEVTNVQLEQGSTATPYTPYSPTGIYTDGTVETIEDTIGNTATAEMLLKVGDYQDVQSIIDGVVTRKVGVKVLDGTEDWNYSASWSDTTHKCFYVTPLTDIKQQTNSSNECLCSHFEWYSRDDLYADKTIIGGCISGYLPTNPESGKALTLRISSSVAVNATAFKSWLAAQYAAGTPVIVVYPLETPTTESVAGQPMQTAAGDNVLEITQASLNNLQLECEYEKTV